MMKMKTTFHPTNNSRGIIKTDLKITFLRNKYVKKIRSVFLCKSGISMENSKECVPNLIVHLGI